MSNARRFAFVSFDSVDDAKTAVKSMSGKALDGREIRVDFAEERGSGEDFQRLNLCSLSKTQNKTLQTQALRTDSFLFHVFFQ